MKIRESEAQMILLTATLSRPVEKLIMTTFCMKAKEVDFIRGSADRPEHSLQVIPVLAEDLLQKTCRLTLAVSQSLALDERAVVFLNDVEFLEQVATTCHTARHHAKLPPTGDSRQYNLEAFASGEHKVMAATTSLTLGFHHSKIRVVIVVNGAYGLREVSQQFGRGGRDGRPTVCYFLDVDKTHRMVPVPVSTCISYVVPYTDEILTIMKQDYVDVEALCTFLTPGKCRAHSIMKCYDRTSPRTCLEIPGHLLCDTCAPDNTDIQFAKNAFRQRPMQHAQVLSAETMYRPPPSENTHGPAVLQSATHVQRECPPMQPSNLSQGTEESNYGEEEPLSVEMIRMLDDCQVRRFSQPNPYSLLMSSHQTYPPATRSQPFASSSRLAAGSSGFQVRTATPFASHVSQVSHHSPKPSFLPLTYTHF